MATQMLCGDEVQGAVIDIGSAFSKFGTSGQDLPRHVFRSSVGTLPSTNGNKYVVGDSSLKFCPSDTEVSNPFVDGTIFLLYVFNYICN